MYNSFTLLGINLSPFPFPLSPYPLSALDDDDDDDDDEEEVEEEEEEEEEEEATSIPSLNAPSISTSSFPGRNHISQLPSESPPSTHPGSGWRFVHE
jgi:hypothetical protein